MSIYVSVVEAEPSLLSLWPLGGDTAPTASDIFGTKPGAYQGTPVLNNQPGPITGDSSGYVALVAGSSQYVSVATPNQPAHPSFEVWLNASTWSDVGALGQCNGTTSGCFMYFTSGSGVSLIVNAGILNAGTDATRNVGWHHYVSTYDGTNGAIYVDGVLKAGPTALTGPITYAASFLIGQYGAPSGTFLTGGLAMAAHYNAALSATAVAAHFAAAGASTVYVPIVKRLRNPLNIHGDRDAQPWMFERSYQAVPAGWVN